MFVGRYAALSLSGFMQHIQTSTVQVPRMVPTLYESHLHELAPSLHLLGSLFKSRLSTSVFFVVHLFRLCTVSFSRLTLHLHTFPKLLASV